MDLAEILVQLWRRRRAVVAVIVFAAFVAMAMTYRFSVSPVGLHHRSVQSGTAETKILVDFPRSSVADLNREFDPLTARAQVLSQLMTTSPVVSRIEQIAGLPRGTVTAGSESTLNLPTSETEPTAERRANDITREGQVYRLTFRAEPEQPTITIFAQAPDADSARKLANAAAQGGAAWVRDTQQRQLVPDSRRTQLTQLGEATAGVVNSGASRIIAALVFIAIVGVGCLLILLVGRTIPAVRAASDSKAAQVDQLRTVRANGARANAGGSGSAKRAKTAAAASSGGGSRNAPGQKSGRSSGRRAS